MRLALIDIASGANTRREAADEAIFSLLDYIEKEVYLYNRNGILKRFYLPFPTNAQYDIMRKTPIERNTRSLAKMLKRSQQQ